jgi:hypothetical protein
MQLSGVGEEASNGSCTHTSSITKVLDRIASIFLDVITGHMVQFVPSPRPLAWPTVKVRCFLIVNVSCTAETSLPTVAMEFWEPTHS